MSGRSNRGGIPPIKLETFVLRAAEAQDNELKDMQKLKDQLFWNDNSISRY